MNDQFYCDRCKKNLNQDEVRSIRLSHNDAYICTYCRGPARSLTTEKKKKQRDGILPGWSWIFIVFCALAGVLSMNLLVRILEFCVIAACIFIARHYTWSAITRVMLCLVITLVVNILLAAAVFLLLAGI